MKSFRFSRADLFAGRVFPWIFSVNVLGTVIVLVIDPAADRTRIPPEPGVSTLFVRLAGDNLANIAPPTPAPAPIEPARSASAESAARPSGPAPGANPGAPMATPDFRASYLSKIIQQVARHKRFPRMERERGRQADVVVRFVILQNGHIEKLELVQASPYQGFNEEALASVQRSLPFPAIPHEIGQDRLVLRIKLKFRLEDT